MQGCQECLAYLIHHGLVQPDICPECHEKALYWKQSEFGTFFLACTNCSTTIAVDLNTPCEEDPVFHQTLQIIVMPSSVVFNNQKLLELAKVFDVNTIQIYRMLKQGFTMDIQVEKLEETASLMTGMNFYLNYFREEMNTPGDTEPIGIILGAYQDKVVMQYALQNITNQLFVSKYQLYLPDREQLEAEFQKFMGNQSDDAPEGK